MTVMSDGDEDDTWDVLPSDRHLGGMKAVGSGFLRPQGSCGT